jgi:hypothetical protein
MREVSYRWRCHSMHTLTCSSNMNNCIFLYELNRFRFLNFRRELNWKFRRISFRLLFACCWACQLLWMSHSQMYVEQRFSSTFIFNHVESMLSFFDIYFSHMCWCPYQHIQVLMHLNCHFFRQQIRFCSILVRQVLSFYFLGKAISKTRENTFAYLFARWFNFLFSSVNTL